MNSNKLQKHVKRKVVNSFNMGQNVGTTSNSQSSCSIFSVDEDVKIVVDNNDDSKFSTVVPVDNSIELSSRTYSKKNHVTYPMITPPPSSTGSFQFSMLSELKSFTSQALKHITPTKPQVKRKLNEKLDTSLPEKIPKKDIGETSKSMTSFTKTFRSTKYKSKPNFVDNYISSDSDIELIEEVIVNPNALNLKSKTISSSKTVHSQSFSQSNRKSRVISETPSRKSEQLKSAPQQASKPCFIADNELIVNEADTAPFMPNNPNIFPDVRCIPSPMKWLSMNGDSNSSTSSTSNSIKKTPVRNPIFKQRVSPEVKSSPSDRSISSRELKSLYENLNEIAWTHKNSFKKLLRNPDYIRHSERGNTGRICKANKIQKNVKPLAVKKAIKATHLKKSPTIQASLKKAKLARVTTNKKLVKLNTNKIAKLKVKQLAKHKNGKVIKLGMGKPPKSNKKELSKMANKVKLNEGAAKTKALVKAKVRNNLEKSNQPKGNKKVDSSSNEKSKVKCKEDSPKLKVDVSKIKLDLKQKTASPKAKARLLPPKVEVSEASSSGMQESFYSDTSFYSSEKYKRDVDGNLKKFIQQDNLDNKNFGGCKKEDRLFSSVRKGSQCRVQIEPLEHTNLWSTECYEDCRKQFLHQTLRKAMEKRDPNCITAMLQELCDSYMSPPTEDSKSKKKKPEEETLRSSVRQLECAFRYKEIVVRKLQNYMQVILVPSYAKRNCLSIDAMKEIRDAFLLAKKDPKCKAVLLNSGGPYFCTGIDLSQLVGSNKKQACEEMASVIRELVLVLGTFSKPVIAAVNGDAYGFGVSLLTYCDVVLASDKATFCVPSASIGYMPEGGITLTLPQVIGNVRSSEMLLQGTRITAAQACEKGLVSGVFWPTTLMHEVIPRIKSIIAQPLQVMEATKLLVRANLWDKLKTHMDFERRLIVNQWLSAPCQENIKRILRGDNFLE